VAGPWYARLPHFRLEFTPSSGQELQSEYLVPQQFGVRALSAIDRIRDRVAPLLQVAEIRTVAADDLWMSPSYGRDSLAIHFTWVKDIRAVTAVLAAVEEQLAPFAARPHWGKLFNTNPDTVRGLYRRLPDFVGLLRHYDPTGKFRNEFLDRYFPATDSLPTIDRARIDT
jgi:alditol oxidase